MWRSAQANSTRAGRYIEDEVAAVVASAAVLSEYVARKERKGFSYVGTQER